MLPPEMAAQLKKEHQKKYSSQENHWIFTVQTFSFPEMQDFAALGAYIIQLYKLYGYQG